MRALLSIEPGGPETLRLEDVAEPVAGPGELLVRVRACSMNSFKVLAPLAPFTTTISGEPATSAMLVRSRFAS